MSSTVYEHFSNIQYWIFSTETILNIQLCADLRIENHYQHEGMLSWQA